VVKINLRKPRRICTIAVRAFSRDCARKKRLRSRQGANGLFRYDKHVGLSFWTAVRMNTDFFGIPGTILSRANCSRNGGFQTAELTKYGGLPPSPRLRRAMGDRRFLTRARSTIESASTFSRGFSLMMQAGTVPQIARGRVERAMEISAVRISRLRTRIASSRRIW